MPDRVLWIGTQLTPTPRSGGSIRSKHLLEAVAEHAGVDLVTTEESATGLPVASHHLATPPSKVERAVGLARGWPLVTARECARSTIRATRRLERDATHVVVEWAHLFPLVPRTGPYVLSVHNVEADRYPEPRLVAAERRLADDPRATVVVVSDRDRDLLRPDAHVVPNGTDLPATTTDVPAAGDLVFVGAMNYRPNLDAVRWWSAEVWHEGLPPLHVVGRAAHVVPDLPGVRVVGEVESVAPVLDRAALVVVPLREGGGTRIKVLEAFAANRPVLSTAKGVEGLDAPDACVVADDPRAFGDAVTALLADLPRRRALAAAGRTVAERHAWGPLAERFAEIVLASPRRRP